MGALVLVERRDAIRILTFNRPDKLNALSSAMLAELEHELEETHDDAACRVVVLTGSGDRAFMAGADIVEYAEQTDEDFDTFQRSCRRVFDAIDRFPKPVIGAINRYALGGGFEIALSCDLLVASANARFGLPEGLLGLIPGGGGTQRLTRAAGPFVAADVLLSARRLTADEALAAGLVSEVVEGNVVDAAVAKGDAIAKLAPLAVAELLGLVRTAMEEPLEDGLTHEQNALLRLRRTDDAAEGVRAFVGKREPRFLGS
ncbi:MAG TPA: enoyl-CoA hydratase/isomerase family protein [Actinomycetota bacterium]|nr:enoyl-CoA hydratase/isomerase family protein [Actinomycetota bacterium]